MRIKMECDRTVWIPWARSDVSRVCDPNTSMSTVDQVSPRSPATLVPPGSAHLGAGPDCLIATPSGELGIEVTRIPREPDEVRKCRELIERHGDIMINRAERLYETDGGPPR